MRWFSGDDFMIFTYPTWPVRFHVSDRPHLHRNAVPDHASRDVWEMTVDGFTLEREHVVPP